MGKMNRIELRSNTTSSKDLSFLGAREVVQVCAMNGCGAVAITDHNSVRSYWDAEQAAQKLGIQLIYGLTLDCLDKDDRYQVTVLAKNQDGLENIYRLVTLLNQQEEEDSYVTRQQLEAHREGLLLGSNFQGGQVSRGLLLRRNTTHMREIVRGYDYLELMVEPYDLAIQVYQLARECKLPVCGIQDARLGQKGSTMDRHAFRASAMHLKTEDRPDVWQTPDELEQQFRKLYVLPGEDVLIQQALYDGPARILEQIEEELTSLPAWMTQWKKRRNRAAEKRLQEEVDAALERCFSDRIPAEAVERTQWELDWIIKKNAAVSVLFLVDTCRLLRGNGQVLWLAGSWNASWLLALLGITDLNWGNFVLEPDRLGKKALMWDNHWNTAFELHCSKDAFEVMESKVAMCFFSKGFFSSDFKNRSIEQEDAREILDCYLETLRVDERKRLQDDDTLRWSLTAGAGPYRVDRAVRSYYMLPELLPTDVVFPMGSTQGKKVMALDLEHRTLNECAASVILVASEFQSALQACHEAVKVTREIDLEDPDIYAALPELFMRHYNARQVKMWKLLSVSDLEQLVRFRGHLYSTGVWDKETEERVKRGELCAQELPAFREDIYQYLVEQGASEAEAVDIMDAVTFGLPAYQGFSPVQQAVLDQCGAEPWFQKCCRKILHLFPYAICYTEALNIVRLLWYHLNYPDETADAFLRAAKALGKQCSLPNRDNRPCWRQVEKS